MKIVSLTLANEAAASVTGDALRSVVDWVDECVLIHTDPEPSRSLSYACQGLKLRELHFPWCDDFSAARNFALAHAEGDWAVRVDSDERIDGDPRAALASVDPVVDFAYATREGGHYQSASFFRLPSRVRYEGLTHEACYSPNTCTIPGVTYRELPKTPEQLAAKHARDIRLLTKMIEQTPAQARWWFYRGGALQDSGQHADAIPDFLHCAELSSWDEEAAWACYRAGNSFCVLGRHADAVRVCALGLAKHAGIGELAWLAGYASYWGGNSQQAAYWSEIAVKLGCYAGIGESVYRIGFRYPEALWEKPYDVLRFAYDKLGRTVEAVHAKERAEQARMARVTR